VVWSYVREQLREPSQDPGTDESDAGAAAPS